MVFLGDHSIGQVGARLLRLDSHGVAFLGLGGLEGGLGVLDGGDLECLVGLYDLLVLSVEI